MKIKSIAKITAISASLCLSLINFVPALAKTPVNSELCTKNVYQAEKYRPEEYENLTYLETVEDVLRFTRNNPLCMILIAHERDCEYLMDRKYNYPQLTVRVGIINLDRFEGFDVLGMQDRPGAVTYYNEVTIFESYFGERKAFEQILIGLGN